MTLAFFICAVATLGSAIAAMTLRNLVHCALSLVLSFAGLAAIYLQLGAQFIGFAQILIYIGAIAILIVFALLLTRGSEPPPEPVFSAGSIAAVFVALSVFALILVAVFSSKALSGTPQPAPVASVRQLGEELMTNYILPFELLGLLLTAALIGAVIIAFHEKRPD
jgi:NADH-quinone oxidoreductase subunit J